MTNTDDKRPRRRIMEVEEVADEKEIKKVAKEEVITPPPTSPEPEEETMVVAPEQESPFRGMAEELKETKEVKEEPKKDIVSELFRTNDATVSYPDVSVGKKGKIIPVFAWVIILLVIVGSIGGGLLFWKQNSGNTETPKEETQTTEITLTPSPTETPTPAASVSAATKKGITIQVWNGSGKAGAASLMKELLEEKGYTVKGTGNAPSYSKDATAIYVKSSKKEYLDLLETDIGEKYSLGTTAANLDDSVAFDARVIVGEE